MSKPEAAEEEERKGRSCEKPCNGGANPKHPFTLSAVALVQFFSLDPLLEMTAIARMLN